MIVPESNLRSIEYLRLGKAAARLLRGCLRCCAVAVVVWVVWVKSQIQYYATHDEARAADAIAVFGAAEYDGRPSPVLRARLDHGLVLYREKLAPLMITLGGGDPADRHSEGGVGHDYLMAHGVPDSAIIAETESGNTEGVGTEAGGDCARKPSDKYCGGERWHASFPGARYLFKPGVERRNLAAPRVADASLHGSFDTQHPRDFELFLLALEGTGRPGARAFDAILALTFVLLPVRGVIGWRAQPPGSPPPRWRENSRRHC